MAPNDSFTQRGDREARQPSDGLVDTDKQSPRPPRRALPGDQLEDTGDNEARPDELGSGFAQATVDPTAFGGTTSIRHATNSPFSVEEELRDYDGLEVVEANDGRLGLTNYGDVPPDDWAADTGETKTPDGER